MYETFDRLSRYKLWLLFLLYALMIIGVSGVHEIWRDEAVLINILRDSSSLADFIAKTQNYGHPRLWHVLLYAGYHLYPTGNVIKILNLSVCASAMLVFLHLSPFRLTHKILFSFGLFPLYIYPAFNRSYGLCMLLIFALAVFYRDRWKHIFIVSLLLILMANTHVHMLIIALAITIGLAPEAIWDGRYRNKRNIWALMITLVGIGLAAVSVVPTSPSSLTQSPENLVSLVKSVLLSLTAPGKLFDKVFGYPSGLFSTVIIAGTAVYFWNKRHLFTIYVLGVFGLSLFSTLFYPASGLRHQGSLFLYFMFMLWIDGQDNAPKPAPAFLRPYLDHMRTSKKAYLSFILLLQICAAYPAIRKDIVSPYSSAKDLAAFVTEHPQLEHAVFVPEPGFILESAPFYKPDISIYLPRESVERSYVTFTDTSHQTLTLDELLESGERLAREKKTPVVFAVGHALSDDGPFRAEMDNHLTFLYSRESLERFKSATTPLASFRQAISDENYDLYLLNGTP